MATILGATTIKIHTDSQLVARQITREFIPKEEKMSKYKDVAIKAMEAFKDWPYK